MLEKRVNRHPRVKPMVRYQGEGKFRKRFRLSREKVHELAADFGRAQFATQGTSIGGGLSHEEHVSVTV